MLRLRHDKLTANALSLLAATALTGLGILVFWEVVAREHPAGSVGTAFAEVSALTFISMVAQLNLTNVFIRFLPASGRFGTRFVWRSYLAVAVIGIAVGVGYVATGLASQVVPADFPNRLLFVAAVPLFAVFALEDSVLTALRITHWVPLENGATVLVRIVMLPVLVFLPARPAILVAWIGPVVLAVIIVNGFLFGRALPAMPHREGDGLPPWRRLASFVVAEYLTSIFGAAVLQVMPLIVVSRLGPTEGGYFAIPWLICTSITVVLWNVGSSFIVEVVNAGEYSKDLMRRSLRLWGLVCAVSMFGVLVVGPFALRAAGPGYASHATVFLLIIGVSVPFGFVRVLYSAFTWLEQRVWMLLGITIVSAVALLGLAVALLGLGLAGIGWAYLISQVVGAALMAPPVWSRLQAILMADGPLPLQGAILRDQRPGSAPWAGRAPAASAPATERADPRPARRAGQVPERLTIAAWAGLVVAVIAPLVVLLGTDHTGRFVAIMLFALLVPGTAVTCWLDTGDGIVQMALTVAISLATYALAATVLLWASAWHPDVVLLLAIPSGLSCLRRLAVASAQRPGGAPLRTRLGR